MIRFFNEDVPYQLLHRRMVRAWLEGVIRRQHYSCGDIQFILCSDAFLLGLNKKFLNHDYYTDVITFDYCNGKTVSGDVYISIDRVRENARLLGERMEDELHRVMVHGLLHLLGMQDKSAGERTAMRTRENKELARRKP